MSPSTYSPAFSQSLLTESEFPFPESTPSPPPYTTSPLFTTTRQTSSNHTSNLIQPQVQPKISKKKSSVLSSFESLWGVERVSQTWGTNVNINSSLKSPYGIVYTKEISSKTAARLEKDLERRKKENVWFKRLMNGSNDTDSRRKAAVMNVPWA